VVHFFEARKEVRQCDPLSILFNNVVDMLAILVARTRDNGQFTRVDPYLVDDGLSILHYSYVIIFYENNLEHANNMKLFLCAFEQLSNLMINFHKR
jgi:hypothetical protein